MDRKKPGATKAVYSISYGEALHQQTQPGGAGGEAAVLDEGGQMPYICRAQTYTQDLLDMARQNRV